MSCLYKTTHVNRQTKMCRIKVKSQTQTTVAAVGRAESAQQAGSGASRQPWTDGESSAGI